MPDASPVSAPPLHFASILAVGTEITTGQILNRNAATLAERLAGLGVETVLHEAVPDERALIAGALERCSSNTRLVVVTGGLGPTSDDFTREVIADWAKAPLAFDAPSWDRIESALKVRWSAVAQSNRRQCWFPRGASILPNPVGTASGFVLELPQARLIVLPGPPREIEAIWAHNDLDAYVSSWVPAAVPLDLKTWQCLGLSESELAERIEVALSGSGLAIGYRAHRPFVEIKVWIPRTAEAQAAAAPYLQKLEQAIGPWIATRQGADLAERWLKQIGPSRSLELLDAASAGVILERCSEVLRRKEGLPREVSLRAVFLDAVAMDAIEETLMASKAEVAVVLARVSESPGCWRLGVRGEDGLRTELLESPFNHPGLEDRHVRYVAEWSLKLLRDWRRS